VTKTPISGPTPFGPAVTRNLQRRLNFKTTSKTPSKKVKAVHPLESGRFNEELSEFA